MLENTILMQKYANTCNMSGINIRKNIAITVVYYIYNIINPNYHQLLEKLKILFCLGHIISDSV